MLIPRKITCIPYISINFRGLNSRLFRHDCSFALVRDAIQISGASKCAYHTLRLFTEAQKYFGITAQYGSNIC